MPRYSRVSYHQKGTRTINSPLGQRYASKMQNGEFMRQILVEYARWRGQKVSSQGRTEDSRDTSGAHPGEQKTSSVGTTARLTHIFAALTHNLAQKTAPRRQRACEMSPLPFEANLCVKIDFGQRYGSPNFD